MLLPRPGSSPHTRGTPSSLLLVSKTKRDHPRIRGEHSASPWSAASSPRIIPAYAGNTAAARRTRSAMSGSSPHTRGTRNAWSSPKSTLRDHPRIRGEHEEIGRVSIYDNRIIPAYAGNTASRARTAPLCRGSSPHTRGTRA